MVKYPVAHAKTARENKFWGHRRFLNDAFQFPNLGVVGSNPAGRASFFNHLADKYPNKSNKKVNRVTDGVTNNP